MTIYKDIILNILKGPIKQCGYKLVDINFVNHNKDKIVQIFIYRAQGIDFKDCEKVNNIALGLISTEKLCLQDYTLEISSPGIFMKLSKPEHYRIFKGKRIKVELLKEFQGYKFATGNIENCFEDGIKLKIDYLKSALQIPFSMISKANLEPEITI